jgi:GBP family porin
LNKHLIRLCGLAIAAGPALVQAQAGTTVTLYGVADIAVVHNSNNGGGSRNDLSSGALQSSRLGFRGREDLGGGLYALFVLEHGLDLSTGSPTSATTFWNRQTFVGLGSNTLGTVTAGLQYTPVYDHLILLSGAPTFGVAGGAVDGIALPGSSAGRFDNTIGGSRVANSVKYTSPVFGGFKANAMVSAGEGSATVGSLWSAGVGYNQGPISSGLAVLHTRCPNGNCTPAQAENKVIAAGVGYDFGVAKLAGIYTNQRNARNVKGNEADVLSALVTVPIGAWVLSAGYQTLDDKTAARQDLRQYNLGALYFLSKRTSFYGFWADQDVKNGGKASMGVTNSSDGRQNQVGAGVRHLF